MSDAKTFPLRLPRSVRSAASEWARRDGVSMNQFVATAVAEKLSVLETCEFFEDRARRADYETFQRVVRRSGGEPPREGDEIEA